MSRLSVWRPLAVSILLSLTLSGCSAPAAQQTPAPQDWPVGWRSEAPAQTFDRENLFDLVNGQADSYFAYGFEQVTAHELCHTQGPCLTVQIWRVDSPTSAYGLYSSGAAGTPVDMANGGDEDPGRRLLFWQERYLVEVFAREAMSPEDLRAFATFVSSTLPAGGEPPALLGRLPQAGLEERPPLYFREEISLQNELWLGGENILGLGPDTEGILAHYTVQQKSAQLLLVHYSDASEATVALDALTNESPDGLLLAEAHDALLGAIFGDLDAEETRELLAEALR